MLTYTWFKLCSAIALHNTPFWGLTCYLLAVWIDCHICNRISCQGQVFSKRIKLIDWLTVLSRATSLLLDAAYAAPNKRLTNAFLKIWPYIFFFDMWYICMNLWAVSVLELNSNPEGQEKAPCACQKTDPSWQPTLWFHYLCLEVLTVHSNDLHLVGAKASHILGLLMSPISHSSSAVGTAFNIFSYDTVWAKHRAWKPRPSIEPITFPCRCQMHYVLCHGGGYTFL